MTDLARPQIRYIENRPKYLWFLMLSYAMIIAISNWFDARLIEMFGKTISPGTLVFPLTFLISDMITEVYGYKHARRAIWAALLFNIIFLAYGQILIHMPSPASYTDNVAFDKLLTANVYIVIGSFLSYIISEPINSYILAKMKLKCKGEFIGLRFITSTLVASALDSIVFVIIAYGHLFPISDIFQLMLNIWLVKVAIEIIGLPISIRLTKILKRKEQIDMYDENTDFNPLSLDASYNVENNKYKNV